MNKKNPLSTKPKGIFKEIFTIGERVVKFLWGPQSKEKKMDSFKTYILEKTKWKKGDGRPRGGSSIENVRFWDLSDAELNFIMKDAKAAMEANPKGKKAGKYADEVNDGATVLFWRKKNKIKVEK